MTNENTSSSEISHKGSSEADSAAPKQNMKKDVVLARNYLAEKAFDGVLLGVPTACFQFIPSLAKLGKALSDTLISMPFAVVVSGFFSMILYTAFREEHIGGYFRRIIRVWFDTVQQFFCLGVGAFPIIAAASLAESLFESTSSSSAAGFGQLLVTWAIFLILATLCGSAWLNREVHKKDVPQWIERIALATFVLCALATALAIYRWGFSRSFGWDIREVAERLPDFLHRH